MRGKRKPKVMMRQKPLRRKRAARGRSQKPKRHRPTLKEVYGPLIEWVAFANGDDPPMGVPLIAINFRAQARDFINQFARRAAASVRYLRGPQIFEAPPLPPERFQVAGNRLTKLGPFDLYGAFLKAVGDRDVDRVQICQACDKPFVALNALAKTCVAACSNRQSSRKFYSKNQAAEQKRKRDEYQAVKERKERLKDFLQRDRRRD